MDKRQDHPHYVQMLKNQNEPTVPGKILENCREERTVSARKKKNERLIKCA